MLRSGLFRCNWGLGRALRARFSRKEDELTEEQRQQDRAQRPQLTAFDRANYEEIKKQIRDTDQPLKVQNREQQLQQMKARSTKLNLKQFELVKNEEHFKEDASVSRPKGVMDFFDPRVSLKPGTRS